MEKNLYNELTIRLQEEFIDFIADFVSNISGDAVEIGSDKIIVEARMMLSIFKMQLTLW